MAAVASACLAQQDSVKRTVGIGANIQSSDYGIVIPIWLSSRVVLAPMIGLNSVEGSATDYTIGIMPKYYLNTERFAPFVDLKIAAIMNKPASDDDEKKTDLLVGLGVGGEYFLSPNFSFNVEAQANLTSSDENSNRFGNPGGMNFNLATAVGATIYFTRKK